MFSVRNIGSLAPAPQVDEPAAEVQVVEQTEAAAPQPTEEARKHLFYFLKIQLQTNSAAPAENVESAPSSEPAPSEPQAEEAPAPPASEEAPKEETQAEPGRV